jgi:hypothetical protein
MWYSIFEDWFGPIFKVDFGSCFTKKKPNFGTRKMKNEFFVQRK